MPRSEKKVIAALDIGTSKVVCIIAEMNDENQLQVIGVGTQPSRGLKRGVIVNIDSTVQAIQKAVEDAEKMADCKVTAVSAGISGTHIQSLNSTGVVAIREHEVSDMDVDRVIEAAKAVAIAPDQRILHILPQEFIIDEQGGIKEPVGMAGVRLETKVHMVTGSISAAQNIVRCIRHCGLEVADLVLEQLASSYAVLGEDEREQGVCLVDIGSGKADVCVFTEGAIRFTSVIPIGGSQVTNDIAHALRTPTQYAEAIKLQYGMALARIADPAESIEVPGMADRPGRTMSLQTLASVIEARYEELFNFIYEELQANGHLDRLAAGIVLTGGGAKMRGVMELAEEIFRVPVRIGVPQQVTGLTNVICNPIYATGVGLLLYSQQQQGDDFGADAVEPVVEKTESKLVVKMKQWFARHF